MARQDAKPTARRDTESRKERLGKQVLVSKGT